MFPRTLSIFSLNGSSHPSYNDMFEVSTINSLLYRCKTCSKEVTNRWHHYHSHTSERSFCPYCPATYSRIDTLRSHMRAKHPVLLSHDFIIQALVCYG
ncbi:hypothetical protein Trydic_g6612 [Trypoxylus dichotomus]